MSISQSRRGTADNTMSTTALVGHSGETLCGGTDIPDPSTMET